jgi:hypothetical protein
MKNIISSVLFFLMIANISVAMYPTEPIQVSADFNKIYIPGGYDSNDLVQIVGEGYFPTSCYRPAPAHVRIDEVKKQIVLGPVAYSYRGTCPQVIVPFQRVIVQGLNIIGELNIREATTSSADDYPYAPVSQAFFYQKGATKHAIVNGTFTDDCQTLDQIKLTVEADVVVLQPIARIESRTDCKSGAFPFSKLVSADDVPPGRYLFHIRSLNGNAINSLLDVN